MNAKLELLKNILIDFINILLVSINFAYTYFMLFLNRKFFFLAQLIYLLYIL